MTPLKMLQTSPLRANELFAQIADTTPGALKTRERLFAELKGEIELSLRLEHDHLLPVLKKHTGTKTLLAQTTERVRDLNTLLRDLDKASKDGDEFPVQVRALKTAFTQHLRDEKSALLPKVQQVLSAEELGTVAERMEADRAQVEATARHEAEVERAQARRRRDEAQARQDALEDAEREERRLARQARAAVLAAEREAEQVVEQTVEVLAAPTEVVRVGTEGMAQAVQTVQGAAQEWMSLVQTRMQNQMQGFSALMQCRTPQDLFALQTRLVREDAELLLGAAQRVSGAVVKATARHA